MVRERLAQDWIDRMYSIFENEPRLPDREVAARLQQEGENLGRDDYPALRTVNKYHKKYIDEVDPEIKKGYREFRWPESMEAGLLPWEASTASLELLGVQQSMDLLSGLGLPIGRPSVRLARWYWWVTLAAPDLPASWVATSLEWPSRYEIARALAACEVMDSTPQNLRDEVEAFLSYAPWRGPGEGDTYNIAVERGQISGLRGETSCAGNYGRNLFPYLFPSGFALRPYSKEAMIELLGRRKAEIMEEVLRDLPSQQQNHETKEDTNDEAPG